MTATLAEHVGTVASGDVQIFFRRFGSSTQQPPLLLLHGANYYDSRDWVGVAADLSTTREVVTYDARGYGLSTWSPNHDYSLDAQLADVSNLLDALDWDRAVLVGHSRGGLFSLLYGHASPERVAGLVLVDHAPGQLVGRPAVSPMSVGAYGPVYESLEQAHSATSRNPREMETDAGRARVESIFAPRDGGWVNVRRDPAFSSDRPSDQPDWMSALAPVEPWRAFAGIYVRVPTQIVRGTLPKSYTAMALARLRRDFPRTRLDEVASGHDVPGAAATELVTALREFGS